MLSNLILYKLDSEGNCTSSINLGGNLSPKSMIGLINHAYDMNFWLSESQIIPYRKLTHPNTSLFKGLSPKKVKYYPLYEGLACIEDKTGQFLCFPDEVDEILKYVEFTPCVSVCSTGSVRMQYGSWYIFSLKWQAGEYKELVLRSVSIMYNDDDPSYTFNYNEKEIQEIGLNNLLEDSENVAWTMLTFSDVEGKLYYIYFN